MFERKGSRLGGPAAGTRRRLGLEDKGFPFEEVVRIAFRMKKYSIDCELSQDHVATFATFLCTFFFIPFPFRLALAAFMNAVFLIF